MSAKGLSGNGSCINALNAFRRELITDYEFIDLLEQVKELLFDKGYENPALRGNHVMLSLNSKGELIRDVQDRFEIRLCNFEFIKPCWKSSIDDAERLLVPDGL